MSKNIDSSGIGETVTIRRSRILTSNSRVKIFRCISTFVVFRSVLYIPCSYKVAAIFFQSIVLMAVTRPGSFNISCRACLENPHLLVEGGKIGSVDALLFGSRAVNHTSIVTCFLHFYQGEAELRDGVYDISANVRYFIPSSFAFRSSPSRL
jgi:hypothetical protein